MLQKRKTRRGQGFVPGAFSAFFILTVSGIVILREDEAINPDLERAQAMEPTKDQLAAASKYLAVFEESWQASHAEAMRLCDFEERLAQAVKVFELVDELIQQQRGSVFRGLTEPSIAVEKAEKEAYSLWLALIDEDIPQLEALENTYRTVQGADRLRVCREKAIRSLQNWQPARPALAMGSRVMEFDAEDADQIRELLNAPMGSPGRPTQPPRPLQTGDPSVPR